MTDQQAAAVIRRAVRELDTHPRFAGRHFGPNSALELLYQLAHYLEGREVKWPKPEPEWSDDDAQA